MRNYIWYNIQMQVFILKMYGNAIGPSASINKAKLSHKVHNNKQDCAPSIEQKASDLEQHLQYRGCL